MRQSTKQFGCILSLVMVGLSSYSVEAFSSPSTAFTTKSYTPRSLSTTTTLFMSDDDNTPATTKAKNPKEFVYDEISGRFMMDGEDPLQCDPNDEYCATDKTTGKSIRLTVEEKERIFLDALQTYYSTGRQILSDDEFDLLKEDLQWSGSDMVVMNRKEAAYLNAVQEYLKGSPTMSDAEFDALKKELMEEGSKFAVQTEPQCYIDTGICKVTLQQDNFRNNLLYLPAGVALYGILLGPVYEIFALIFGRTNPLVFVLLGFPAVFLGAKFFTEEYVFQNKLVAYGPCPNCSYENRVYFGDILGVEGFGDLAQCKCPNCKDVFRVQRDTLRASTLPKSQ